MLKNHSRPPGRQLFLASVVILHFRTDRKQTMGIWNAKINGNATTHQHEALVPKKNDPTTKTAFR